MSTLTFKNIADRLQEGIMTPDEISTYRSFCAAWLYRFYEQYGQSVSSGAEWQTLHRDEHKSQAETERAWYATEQGRSENELKYRIRGVEAIEKVLTSLYYQANKEMRLAENNHGL